VATGNVDLAVVEEQAQVVQEAARRRELDHILSFSAPHDSTPVARRRAQRFMLVVMILDQCQNAKPGAYVLLHAAANLLAPQSVGALNRTSESASGAPSKVRS
jgi:hypothetical protein